VLAAPANSVAFLRRFVPVIDDVKALSAPVREVFGAKALVQRCRLHKRCNLTDRLPDKGKA
jgi:putative transposase